MSHEAKAYHGLAPSQGKPYHVHPKFLSTLLDGMCATSSLHMCHPHCVPYTMLTLSMADTAVPTFYNILMCGIKQCNMAPHNLIIWLSKCASAPFCDKEDCPIHFSINPDNVESMMIDFEGSELWDPDHKFYDKQTRVREICTLREDYMKDW
ncbi:hypothetical protein IW262DRAFT_1468272 [Armillaria fumosa]|nr:hypothetical protein IW262DRAFT_1468272 [Armillaria fumosa]